MFIWGVLFHISGIVKIACRCQHVPMPFIFFTIDATLTTAMMEGLPLKITTRHLFLCNLHHLLDPSRVWPISQSLALVSLTTSFLALGSLVLGCECAVSYTLASPACQARPLHSYILFTSYSLWPDNFEMEFWSFLLVLIFNTSNAYTHFDDHHHWKNLSTGVSSYICICIRVIETWTWSFSWLPRRPFL